MVETPSCQGGDSRFEPGRFRMIKYFLSYDRKVIYRVEIIKESLRRLQSSGDWHIDIRPPRAKVVFTLDPKAHNLRSFGVDKKSLENSFDSFEEAYAELKNEMVET